MKHLYIQTAKDGRVMWAVIAKAKPSPWIDTGLTAFPKAEEREGYDAVMYWDGKDIVWQYEPSEPIPEPIPEPEEPTPPTNEEISALRAQAYRDRVDPITCEISRLRDMDGAHEDIADAMARRDAYVEKIKAELPYNERFIN